MSGTPDPQRIPDMRDPVRVLVAIALAGLAVLMVVAFGSYAPEQIGGASPAGRNLIGLPGAWIAYYCISAWGLAAFYLPFAMAGFALALLRDKPLANASMRLTGAVLLIPALAGLLQLMPVGRFGETLLLHWDQLGLHGFGGSMGYQLCGPAGGSADPAFPGGLLVRRLEVGGSALVLATIAVTCVVLMQIGLIGYSRRIWRALVAYRPPHQDGAPPPVSRRDTGPILGQVLTPKRTTTAIKEVAKFIAEKEEPVPADAADLVERIRERRRMIERDVHSATAKPAPSTAGGSEPSLEGKRASTGALEGAPAPAAPAFATPESAGEPPPPRPRPKPARPKREATAEGYALPPVDLLDLVPHRRDTEHEHEKQGTARTIEEVFSNFDIRVKVVAASRGPVITMYEIQLLDQAMRVNKVEGFEKDLSLKLGTEGIRIVAPLPNKKTIGIEVPNKAKEQVVMRDLVEQIDAAQMTLPLVLGRDVVGNPLVGDLAKMPHLLVAGATGTGKSVCMNAMISSILLFRGPEEVKFIMVDPKMVELANYEDIPHLLTPPITDMTKAHAALEWACRTMDERYFALRLVGVRDIKAYNELGDEEIRLRLAKKGKSLDDLPGVEVRMPYIVVLVDEYADLMMVNKEVEKSIIRLCQKSRAAGLHVILTTQRPSADVVTGLIKSNLPARICFRVADKSNSRVVLDAGGAENLLGRGDMLFLPPGSNTLIRGQGVWVKDKEIEAIIEHAKSQGAPQYDETILAVGAVAMVGGGSSGERNGSEWLQDRQFHEAVQSMYRYNRSGADFFRRKLNVGYNKATAYVEQLEDLGFLGPQKGTSPREMLKSWDSWIDLLKTSGLSWEEDDELYHNPVEVRS